MLGAFDSTISHRLILAVLTEIRRIVQVITKFSDFKKFETFVLNVNIKFASVKEE